MKQNLVFSSVLHKWRNYERSRRNRAVSASEEMFVLQGLTPDFAYSATY